MNCPKCNKELDNNSIKCPQCGTRIGRLCPTCKAYNLITSQNCTNCNETLLKVCPDCKSMNLPSSTICRKCGTSLDTIKPNNTSQISSYEANYHTLATAKDNIMSSIKAENIKIISINGNNELGKNYVFKALMKETSIANYAWLMGTCTPHTQLTPIGFIQNVLLNIFNIPNFCSNKNRLKRESIKFFKQDFKDLTTDEIYNLLNILYPENIDNFSNIEANKQATIKIIIKVFETILQKMNAVLVIENIEYLDSFSYEILNIMLNNELFHEKLTILISYSKEQSGINYFSSPILKDNNYVDITILPFSKEQVEPIFEAYKELNISTDLKSKIMHFAQDNPILVEQLICMVADVKDSTKNIKLTSNIKELLQYRLELLKENDYNSYLLLCALSILGFKFHSIILDSIFNMEQQEIEQRLNKLIKMNFITPSFNFGYQFKTLSIWNDIIEIFKYDDEIFRAVNQALYPLVSEYTLSTLATLAYITQNLNFEEQTFNIWGRCSDLTAYIGDTGLYIILEKQILSLLDKIELENSDSIKLKVYSELGKLLEPQNPHLAIEYLPKAVMLVPDDNFVEKIELLGYLASCSMNLKNYHGVIECINNTLLLIPDNFTTEIALLKLRQIQAYEALGNAGAVINIADNDIIPVLENAINNKIHCKTVSLDIIFEAWIKTNLCLTKALIMQGDNRAYKVLDVLADVCKTNNINDNELSLKINLYLAIAKTITGQVRESVNKLDELLSSDVKIDDKIMSIINLTSILNRFFMNKEELTYDELFQVSKFADDIDDDFTKNILKLILGRLIQDRTSAKEAIAIYTKQIEYFAEKQNAIGVLLGWYFISEAKLVIDGPNSALDIAMKALDVAESANVSNYYFTLLLNKLIGEIYLALQDFDSSKVYIEKALLIAKNFDLKYQLIDLYLLYSRYLQDYASTLTDKKIDNILLAEQMNKKAALINDELKLISATSAIEKANTILNSFCQVNGISLK